MSNKVDLDKFLREMERHRDVQDIETNIVLIDGVDKSSIICLKEQTNNGICYVLHFIMIFSFQGDDKWVVAQLEYKNGMSGFTYNTCYYSYDKATKCFINECYDKTRGMFALGLGKTIKPART